MWGNNERIVPRCMGLTMLCPGVQEYEFDALMRTADGEQSGEQFEPFTQGRKQAPWQAFPEPSAFARASGGSGAALAPALNASAVAALLEMPAEMLGVVCMLELSVPVCALQSGLHLRTRVLLPLHQV